MIEGTHIRRNLNMNQNRNQPEVKDVVPMYAYKNHTMNYSAH